MADVAPRLCPILRYDRAVRLLINADDLGYSSAVNAAIFDLLSRGRATSATVIVNAPAADEALSRLAEFPQCSFGVHLNLSGFRPLTNPLHLQPLLRSDGEFDGDLLRRTPFSRPLRRAIFEEWSAQINRFFAVGHTPSHLDSHHHAHTIPALFSALKRVQRRYDIRRVRITKNIYGPEHPVSRGLLFRKRLWTMSLRYWYATATTDGFTNFCEFYSLATTCGLKRWIGEDGDRIVELMIHPGNPGFAEEAEFLESNWIGAAGWQLANYRDL
jgi:predicted glycoside hydrolase/deacetylase ChbG (UPF0249 family)